MPIIMPKWTGSSYPLMVFLALLYSFLHLSCYVLASKDFGPFDVEVSDFKFCDEFANPKIKVEIKQKKINSTLNTYDISIVNTIPFDHTLSSMFRVLDPQVPKRAKHSHKNVSMSREFPQFCLSAKAIIPEMFDTLAKRIRKATGEDIHDCNLQPGSRGARNLIFGGSKSASFPAMFWYRKMLLKIYLKKKREIVSCNQVTVETVPKKS